MIVKILKYVLILSVLILSGCGNDVETKSTKQTKPTVDRNTQEEASKRFIIGQRYFDAGKLEHAISNYLEGLKLDPQNAYGHNLLGMAYRIKFVKTGQYTYREKEIKEFRRALELKPMFIAAVKNLAVTLMETGQKEEAAKHFRKALELNPNDSERALMIKLIQSAESRN